MVDRICPVMATTVVFAGDRGTYTDIAARRAFGEPIEVRTVDDPLRVIQSLDTDDRGVFPVENTVTGTFARVADLFMEHHPWIVGEVVVPFHHALVAHPGAEIEGIERVVSRREVLDHCQRFLRQDGWDVRLAANTARAVRRVKQEHGPETAAIAAPATAARYGMEILAEEVQDHDDVRTRFFVVSRYKREIPDDADRTTLGFVTSHKAGALHDALGALGRRGINVTRLDGRPIPDRPWHYAFHADIEGSARDPEVEEALQDLGRRTLEVRLFGSYPSAGSP